MSQIPATGGAVRSEVVMNELRKILDLPPNLRRVTLTLALNAAAIVECEFFVPLAQGPDAPSADVTQRFELNALP